MGAYINLFCVFHASPELAVAGNDRRKSAELNKERGVEKNDKTTLEMEGQLKVTKKNQSFLPLTAVQAGNKVAAPENCKNRRTTPSHRTNSASTDPRRSEVRKNENDKLLEREGRSG